VCGPAGAAPRGPRGPRGGEKGTGTVTGAGRYAEVEEEEEEDDKEEVVCGYCVGGCWWLLGAGGTGLKN
jgi:hypothetical protein